MRTSVRDERDDEDGMLVSNPAIASFDGISTHSSDRLACSTNTGTTAMRGGYTKNCKTAAILIASFGLLVILALILLSGFGILSGTFPIRWYNSDTNVQNTGIQKGGYSGNISSSTSSSSTATGFTLFSASNTGTAIGSSGISRSNDSTGGTNPCPIGRTGSESGINASCRRLCEFPFITSNCSLVLSMDAVRNSSDIQQSVYGGDRNIRWIIQSFGLEDEYIVDWNDKSTPDNTALVLVNRDFLRFKRIVPLPIRIKSVWFGIRGGDPNSPLNRSDQTYAIQNALSTSSSLFNGSYFEFSLGPGIYLISSISIPSNCSIIGTGLYAPSTTFVTSLNSGTVFVTGNDNVHSGFEIVCPKNENKGNVIWAFGSWNRSNVFLSHLSVRWCNVYQSDAGIGYSPSTVLEYLPSNIRLLNLSGYGADWGMTRPNAASIILQYTWNVHISNCSLTNYAHGIQWWGGDSNVVVNGAIANPRLTGNITLYGNIIDGANGGGIWGSMGNNIHILHNRVSHCFDVCIDFEGCFNGVAEFNHVFDCSNGGLATFYFNRNLTFRWNHIESIDNQFGLKIYNSAQSTDNKDLSVNSNHFINMRNIGFLGGDAVYSLLFMNNTCVNMAITMYRVSGRGAMEIRNNSFLFDLVTSSVSPLIAINSDGILSSNTFFISDNCITSLVQQAAGSIAIFSSSWDYNHVSIGRIERNIIRGNPLNDSSGFDEDIVVRAESGNGGIWHQYFITENTLFSPRYQRIEGPHKNSYVLLEGNRDSYSNPFPDVIPLSSQTQWNAGQLIYYNVSHYTATGKRGARCTQTGFPGIWVEF